MNNCRNCDEPISGNYCSGCGRPVALRRVDRQYVIHEIGEVLGANRGFFYTIKKLITAPGESVRHFLAEDRYRFVKPITFVLVTSLIYVFVYYLFDINIKDYYSNTSESPAAGRIINWIMGNPGYSNILSGLFIAFWVRVFFRKSGYNLFEIFILLCFVFGVSLLFSSFAATLQGLTSWKLTGLATFIGVIYGIWGIGQFFDKKKARYIKAFLSFALGKITLRIIILLVRKIYLL
jgi:hypothetical protein